MRGEERRRLPHDEHGDVAGVVRYNTVRALRTPGAWRQETPTIVSSSTGSRIENASEDLKSLADISVSAPRKIILI